MSTPLCFILGSSVYPEKDAENSIEHNWYSQSIAETLNKRCSNSSPNLNRNLPMSDSRGWKVSGKLLVRQPSDQTYTLLLFSETEAVAFHLKIWRHFTETKSQLFIASPIVDILIVSSSDILHKNRYNEDIFSVISAARFQTNLAFCIGDFFFLVLSFLFRWIYIFGGPNSLIFPGWIAQLANSHYKVEFQVSRRIASGSLHVQIDKQHAPFQNMSILLRCKMIVQLLFL